MCIVRELWTRIDFMIEVNILGGNLVDSYIYFIVLLSFLAVIKRDLCTPKRRPGSLVLGPMNDVLR